MKAFISNLVANEFYSIAHSPLLYVHGLDQINEGGDAKHNRR